jgi:hypothetical protein
VLSEDPGAPTIDTRKHRQRVPWEVMPEDSGVPTSMLKMSLAGPWWVLSEIQERPPSMLKTSMVDPLVGVVGDPEVPTINA